MGLISGSGISSGGSHGNPLQYSCLNNLMDRRAWQATVHRVAKFQTQLRQLSTHAVLNEGWTGVRKVEHCPVRGLRIPRQHSNAAFSWLRIISISSTFLQNSTGEENIVGELTSLSPFLYCPFFWPRELRKCMPLALNLIWAFKALRMVLVFKLNKEQARKEKGLWNSIRYTILKLNGALSTANLVYLFLYFSNSSYLQTLLSFFFLPLCFVFLVSETLAINKRGGQI